MVWSDEGGLEFVQRCPFCPYNSIGGVERRMRDNVYRCRSRLGENCSIIDMYNKIEQSRHEPKVLERV